jgi:hypothetical protein
VGIRRPNQAMGTATPAVVTFDADFSAAAAGSRWMLIALVHSALNPLTLGGADLRAMVVGSRHAAARSVQVV